MQGYEIQFEVFARERIDRTVCIFNAENDEDAKRITGDWVTGNREWLRATRNLRVFLFKDGDMIKEFGVPHSGQD